VEKCGHATALKSIAGIAILIGLFNGGLNGMELAKAQSSGWVVWVSQAPSSSLCRSSPGK
jgi:hypothetical protein